MNKLSSPSAFGSHYQSAQPPSFLPENVLTQGYSGVVLLSPVLQQIAKRLKTNSLPFYPLRYPEVSRAASSCFF